MIMLSQRARQGEPDELIFVAPQHIVSVRTVPDGDGSLVVLLAGQALRVIEERDDIIEEIGAVA